MGGIKNFTSTNNSRNTYKKRNTTYDCNYKYNVNKNVNNRNNNNQKQTTIIKSSDDININTTNNQLATKRYRIIGFAIFNNSLIEYLYDTGADTTIIQESFYKKILAEDQTTELVQYNGKPLKSFTTEIKVIGKLILKQCIFNDSNKSTNVELVVTEDQQCLNKCIIGTDLMSKIPVFKNLLDQAEETIKTMSDDIIQQYNQKFIHIKMEHKQICNINDTIDVKTNEINMVRDKLEN